MREAQREEVEVAVPRGLLQTVDGAGSAGGEEECESAQFDGVRFGGGGVHSHVYGDVDGGVVEMRVGGVDLPVCTVGCSDRHRVRGRELP